MPELGTPGSVGAQGGKLPWATRPGCELPADTGFHSKTSWRRMVEGCEVPRLFARTRGFSSFEEWISLELRLVEV